MSAFWLLVKAYWREIAAVLLMAYAAYRGYGFAYDNGHRDSELAHANKALSDIADANKARKGAEDKLSKALKQMPPTGRKVSDAVTANPTSPDCRVPDDVRNGLQDGIDAGKAATR